MRCIERGEVRTKAVFEAVVRRGGPDVVRGAQLLDVAESLKVRPGLNDGGASGHQGCGGMFTF